MRKPIKLSTLGFGCGPVMGKVDKNLALRAMATAYDLGVTHFDVARSYGFGRAENVLGQFTKGRRDKVTITTKFGIVPPKLRVSTKVIMPIARLVSKIVPQLKNSLKKKSGELLVERNFDVDYARKCLEFSLTELSTDYIDIYLIHEPDVASLKNPEDLSHFLESAVIAGKIKRWGFAYKCVKDYEWARSLGGDVIQFEGNLQTIPVCNEILSDQRQKIITRPFVGGPGVNSINNLLKNTQTLEKLQKIGVSSSDISLYLALELAGNSGSVICSMFNNIHIEKNINAINLIINNESISTEVKNLLNYIK